MNRRSFLQTAGTAGLATGNFETPMKGDLLWVYEGLTNYLGDILAPRSGLLSPEDFRESLYRLVAVLTGMGITMLMTTELENSYIDLRFSPHGTAFLTDAIILQRYVELQGQLTRMMAVVKVRASAVSTLPTVQRPEPLL